MTSSPSERPKVVLTNRSIVLNNKGQILLVQRAKGGSWRSGFWEFPSGKLDKGQDISHALEREVFEETNKALVVLKKNVAKLAKKYSSK